MVVQLIPMLKWVAWGWSSMCPIIHPVVEVIVVCGGSRLVKVGNEDLRLEAQSIDIDLGWSSKEIGIMGHTGKIRSRGEEALGEEE
jgi:hypothetical protein